MFANTLKNSYTRIFILVLSVIMLFVSINGCSNKNQAFDADRNQGKKVVDHAGREVIIPNNPQRIVPLTASLIEGLFAIGITPVTKVDNYNTREEAASLPSAGLQANVNMEVIYNAKPDLIIAQSRHHMQMIELLESSGAAVFVYDPAKLDTNPLFNLALFLGDLLDRENEAAQYVAQVNQTADELKQKIQSETNLKSAVVIEDSDTVRAAQNASSYGTIINSLGLKNIVPDGMPGSNEQGLIPFDMETIVKADPDIILIIASVKDPDYKKQVIDKFKKNPLWKDLTAVKNDRLKVLPFKVHPGRATAEDMLKMTAQTILPEKN